MITSEALDELRERVTRERFPSGVMILGPMEEDCRRPDSTEEAWLLEKAYGPAPRWVLNILPIGVFESPLDNKRRELHVEDIEGIRVGVHTTEPDVYLRVELHGDSIRVIEQ